MQESFALKQEYEDAINILKDLLCPNEMSSVIPCVIQREKAKYQLGNDTIRMKMAIQSKGSVDIIARIRSIEFNEALGLWEAVLASGLRLLLMSFRDEMYPDIIKKYVLLGVTYRSKRYVGYIKKIYGGLEDASAFESIADKLEEKLPRWAILSMFLGYVPTNEVFIVLIPRLVTLLDMDKPIYTAQILPKGTGKTHFGIFTANVMGWEYAVESPSYAFLIYNHRDRIPGAVLLKDGIAFDGIDKWSQRIYVDYEILLTGMDNCLWTRSVGTGSSINKCIKMIFLGNPRDKYVSIEDRERVNITLNNPYSDVFLDRVAMVHASSVEFNIVGAIADKRIDDSYLDLYIKRISRDAQSYSSSSSLSGRAKAHSERLYKALNALGVELDQEAVDIITMYGWEYFLKSSGWLRRS